MAAPASDRPVALGMGVAALAGLLMSLLTSELSEWTTFTWIFAAIALLVAGMGFFYAFTGRSVTGPLPTDPERLKRVRTVSLIGLALMALVIVLELGGAIAGSWEPTDWMFIGIYVGIAIMFIGRLAAIRRAEAGTA